MWAVCLLLFSYVRSQPQIKDGSFSFIYKKERKKKKRNDQDVLKDDRFFLFSLFLNERKERNKNKKEEINLKWKSNIIFIRKCFFIINFSFFYFFLLINFL